MTNGNVMLIEDDASMGALLRTLLEIEGYQVTPTPAIEDEAAMVASIKQANPNVVLMDVHIKNVDGIQTLKLMRQDPDLVNTRVIMTSGMDYRDECQAAGANGFLLKPYMPDDLIRKIKGD